jgi:glycosyltransferase involved in cell wall biosynthesis
VKILFVIPYFYPAEAFGGPVKVALDIGKQLVKSGHKVVVFTSDAKDLKKRLGRDHAEVEGMDVYYFRNLSMSLVKRSMLFLTPALNKKMRSDLKSFDVVHLHEYTTYQNIVVHYYAKKFGIPYILQAHGSLQIIGRQTRKWIFDSFFGSKLIKDSSKVIALSELEVGQYKGAGVPAEKIALIPNGLDLTGYSDLPSPGSFKKKFGLGNNERILLFLGRIHEIKGVDILVRAFASVAHKLDNVKLVIVGPDDGYLERVKALISSAKIEDKVLICGPLYGDAKLEAYIDADIYVLPSRYELFPMTILEAYACGKPVIASDVGRANELVIDGETGLMFESENTKDLASKIFSLMNDAEKAQEMGLKGRQHVRDNFSIEKVAKALEDLYLTAAPPNTKVAA